jgi:fructose-bisphosphate aldolase class II
MGAVRAAEELQAPLIMQIAESRLRYSPLELLGPMMVAAAKYCRMPAAVHLDHGATLETVKLALDVGFTSVMFDGSKYPLDENIRRTQEVKKLAAGYGADVEGEIGSIGREQRAIWLQPMSVSQVWLKPSALRRKTGIDAMAIAIGTAHGNYKQDAASAYRPPAGNSRRG